MSPLVKIHVVCERRICRKQTVRRWIRQKTSLSASLLLSSLCSGSKIQAFAEPSILTFNKVIRGFFRGLRAGSLKSLCIRFLIVLVVTLISSCIDLFISDEEMNGCFWQSCLILQSVLGVVVRGLPLLFKGERLRFCLFLCNIRLTDASESFNRFEISSFL